MELQQLRYVIAVVEEGGFTRAAARCFVVQSALSHQIKALENELGVVLFARTSRRVELTAAGEAFLPHARASLASAEQAMNDAVATTGRIRGALRIGTIPTSTAVDIAATLARLRAEHPELTVSLRVAGSDELVRAIREGSIDIAMLGLPGSAAPVGVASRLLASDRHVAMLPASHPLAERATLQLGELADEIFADFPAGTPGRMQSENAFTDAGLRRTVVFEALSADLLLDLVRENLAITLLPSRVAQSPDGVVAVPLLEGPTRSEYLAWSEFNPRPAAMAFLDALDQGV